MFVLKKIKDTVFHYGQLTKGLFLKIDNNLQVYSPL